MNMNGVVLIDVYRLYEASTKDLFLNLIFVVHHRMLVTAVVPTVATMHKVTGIGFQISIEIDFNLDNFNDKCNLVDPASSHMLVSKIKPCKSEFKIF